MEQAIADFGTDDRIGAGTGKTESLPLHPDPLPLGEGTAGDTYLLEGIVIGRSTSLFFERE